MFSLWQKFWTIKVISCHFLKKKKKKSAVLVKFGIKNGFSGQFPFQKSILLYITVIVWKLQHSICLKKMGSHHSLRKPTTAKPPPPFNAASHYFHELDSVIGLKAMKSWTKNLLACAFINQLRAIWSSCY